MSGIARVGFSQRESTSPDHNAQNVIAVVLWTNHAQLRMHLLELPAVAGTAVIRDCVRRGISPFRPSPISPADPLLALLN